MTLQATNPPPRNPSGYRRTAEFWVYFACILVIALPFCCVGWLRDVLRRRGRAREELRDVRAVFRAALAALAALVSGPGSAVEANQSAQRQCRAPRHHSAGSSHSPD